MEKCRPSTQQDTTNLCSPQRCESGLCPSLVTLSWSLFCGQIEAPALSERFTDKTFLWKQGVPKIHVDGWKPNKFGGKQRTCMKYECESMTKSWIQKSTVHEETKRIQWTLQWTPCYYGQAEGPLEILQRHWNCGLRSHLTNNYLYPLAEAPKIKNMLGIKWRERNPNPRSCKQI